jgi:hypothetical protein
MLKWPQKTLHAVDPTLKKKVFKESKWNNRYNYLKLFMQPSLELGLRTTKVALGTIS